MYEVMLAYHLNHKYKPPKFLPKHFSMCVVRDLRGYSCLIIVPVISCGTVVNTMVTDTHKNSVLLTLFFVSNLTKGKGLCPEITQSRRDS